eukprot:2714829-Rhodomonas_salina.2
MTILEIKLPKLNNKPPKFRELVYPLPKNPDVQKPYYVCIAAGARGTGKSFAIVRCIKNQEITGGFYDPVTGNKVPIRTILMSPTVADRTKEWKDYIEAWIKFSKMTPQQFRKWDDLDAVALLYARDFVDPKELDPPKYPDGL